jgi:alpha-L-arabinofuranosidase
MKTFLHFLSLAVALAVCARAATTITVSATPATTAVKRIGINLSFNTYYDSRLMMKELIYRNPGFEGQTFQSIAHVASGSGNGAVDDTASIAWADGFWNGATYEFISGTARGRTGTVSNFSAAPAGQTTLGYTYTFADTNTPPAAGDYFILRKTFDEHPESGWWNNSTGVTITGEHADLPADTTGRQALRARSTVANGNFSLSSNRDTTPGISFIQLNGAYRVTFKAKSLSGATNLAVRVQRGSTTYVNQTVPLTGTWTTHTVNFTATEDGSARGIVSLTFSLSGQFEFLLDDASFVQANTSPSNPTAFRDAVVDALRLFRPGIIRAMQTVLGDTVDNLLTTSPQGRRRAGFTAFGMEESNIQFGYHELLTLCEHIGAEAWFSLPTVCTPQEARNMVEYLSGPTSTAYGALRARLGHPAPWTDVIPRIHIELGNEAWNGQAYLGAAIGDARSWGARASEIFAAMRGSPYFNAAKFDLALGAHAPETARMMNIHNASTQHDSVTVDGYFFTRVDSFGTDEELFGSLFAQPELYNTTLYMGANYRALQNSSRPVPLSIYEGNINTTDGAIFTSQTALTAATAGVGAGLAVANDLLMKMRELHMRDLCLFNLGGYSVVKDGNSSYIWGTVIDMGVTNRKRPTYLAAALANEVIAGDLLQTSHSGDNPTWNQPEINQVVGGLPGAHFLQSYAFSSADGARALIVFNLHRTSALAVNFAGVNAPTGNVTIRQLTSARISDNNETSTVVAPATLSSANFSATADYSLPPFSMTIFAWSASVAPAAPSAPSTPTQPSTPSTPSSPTPAPETPTAPTTPTAPATPATPATPTPPSTPVPSIGSSGSSARGGGGGAASDWFAALTAAVLVIRAAQTSRRR